MNSENLPSIPMFTVARNPTPGTRLLYLLRLPVGEEEPLVLATSDTWPQGRDLFCYRLDDWPEHPEVLEEVPVQACWRAGKSVHLVLKRRQRRRSMFIWTQSRGRTLIFWRTPKTMQAARPGIRIPSARGIDRCRLSIAVDHRERYAWKFPHHAEIERREIPVGDYGIFFGNNLVAVSASRCEHGESQLPGQGGRRPSRSRKSRRLDLNGNGGGCPRPIYRPL